MTGLTISFQGSSRGLRLLTTRMLLPLTLMWLSSTTLHAGSQQPGSRRSSLPRTFKSIGQPVSRAHLTSASNLPRVESYFSR